MSHRQDTRLAELANGLLSKDYLSSPAPHLIVAPHGAGGLHHLGTLSQERAPQGPAPDRASVSPPSCSQGAPAEAEGLIRRQVSAAFVTLMCNTSSRCNMPRQGSVLTCQAGRSFIVTAQRHGFAFVRRAEEAMKFAREQMDVRM